jgi:hypothetical protein
VQLTLRTTCRKTGYELRDDPCRFATARAERRETLLRFSPLLCCIAGAQRGWRIGGRSSEHVAVARALLEAGASPNAADILGFTPFHLVTDSEDDRSRKICAMLGQYGGDPNKRNRIGCVPLIEVVMGRRFKCIKLLLQAGADPTLEDLSSAALTPTERESDEHRCPPDMVDMYTKFFGLSVDDARRKLLSEAPERRDCVPTPISLANAYPDALRLFRQMAAPRARPPERESARTAVTIIAEMRTHSQGVRNGVLDDALARAEDLRRAGKEAFEARDYALALQKYEAAITSLWPIETKPGVPWPLVACVSNKAESLLQLGEYEPAADTCEDARALIFQHGHLFDRQSCIAIEQKLASREARAQAGKERERRREARAAAQRAEERLKAERAAQERDDAEEAARRATARQEAAAEEARAAQLAQEAEDRRAAQQRQAGERQRRAEQVAAEAQAAERRAVDARAEEQRQRDAARREEEERAAEQRRVVAAQREAVVVRRRQQRQAREDARLRQQAEAQAAVEAERQQALQRAADAEEWRQEVERQRAQEALEREELALVMEMSRRDEWLRSREAARAQARAQAQLQAQPQAQAASSSSSADADLDVDIECAICCEDVVPLWMPCGKHALHISCAAQWRMQCRSGANNKGRPMEPTCPTCREPI